MIEAAAGVPLGALIAMGRNTSRIFHHSRQMHQIPGHEGRVAIGEIILGPARSGIQI